MAKKKKKDSGPALMSSAGLMRYFETDRSAVNVSPKTVVMICIFCAVVLLGLEIYFHVWP
ncbi:MAG: preprotein translocase subunit Sec61beta [Candidatus Syntropharchaeia archaeon]